MIHYDGCIQVKGYPMHSKVIRILRPRMQHPSHLGIRGFEKGPSQPSWVEEQRSQETACCRQSEDIGEGEGGEDNEEELRG